jgi:hypothetical protein
VAGPLFLGEPFLAARHAIPGAVVSEASTRPVPLDAEDAPVGLTYFPGFAREIRAQGEAAIVDRGRVRVLLMTAARSRVLGTIHVGDSLRGVRERFANLRCMQSSERVPACAGRTGHNTLILAGDPIRTIVVSSIDTGWCLVPSASCHRASAAAQIAMR